MKPIVIVLYLGTAGLALLFMIVALFLFAYGQQSGEIWTLACVCFFILFAWVCSAEQWQTRTLRFWVTLGLTLAVIAALIWVGTVVSLQTAITIGVLVLFMWGTVSLIRSHRKQNQLSNNP